MNPSESTPQIDVGAVNVDHVNMPAGAGAAKSNAAQTWTALTPVLTILISTIAMLLTFFGQMAQVKQASMATKVEAQQARESVAAAAQQKEDSDWRQAVEKVSITGESSAITAYEMESFLSSPRYGGQARSIAVAASPVIADAFEFDSAFFVLLGQTNEGNQGDLLNVARSVSNHVRDLHRAAMVARPGRSVPKDGSLQHFVISPEDFFVEGKETDQLKEALLELWKLDSVSSGLSSLWLGGQKARVAKPQGADLAGILFLGHDFRGLDFRSDDLTGTVFLGAMVDPALLPAGYQASAAVGP
jgi:hypothetical protein